MLHQSPRRIETVSLVGIKWIYSSTRELKQNLRLERLTLVAVSRVVEDERLKSLERDEIVIRYQLEYCDVVSYVVFMMIIVHG